MGGRHFSLKIWRDAAKFRGEMPHLSNSKSVWKKKNCACAFHSTKNYLFHCSIFQTDWIFSNSDDKSIKIVARIQTLWVAGFAPHRHSVVVTVYRLAGETGTSEISKMKLKQQDMTAESLSLARAQRMNQNTVGTYSYFNMLEKGPPTVTFLTHLGLFSILMKL